MFDELYIDDYCNFNTYRMGFDTQKQSNDCANLNLIIGKNGSGKSSLLDALFEIGQYNLKSNNEKIDNTNFDYKLSVNNKIINTNMNILNCEYLTDEEKQNYQWDAVIRLHTGHTARQFYSYRINTFSLTTNTTKWAFFAYITSGIWTSKNEDNINLWENFQDIVFGEKNHIEPKVIWLDVKKNYNGEEIDNSIIPGIRKPDVKKYIGNDITRYFWNLDNPIFIEPFGSQIKQQKVNPLPVLFLYLNKLEPIKISNNLSGRFLDTGFLYTQGNNKNLYPDSFLSDGEHGFLTRFALLMLLREENMYNNKHYLILLDEPETHFNENWKTYFLHLLCKIFNNTNHDIFIATHSAMLVTDAKDNEINRLDNLSTGIIHYPVPIKTFGANIIDIGKVLFQMEDDIGKRSKDYIENALKNNDKDKLKELLKQVGPGEWRWKIRAKLNQLEKADSCCNYKAKRKSNANSRRES